MQNVFFNITYPLICINLNLIFNLTQECHYHSIYIGTGNLHFKLEKTSGLVEETHIIFMMAHLTGDPKWDIFVIYMFISITFLFWCCLILACLFIFSPADDRSGLNRPNISMKRHRQHNAVKRNTIPRINQRCDVVVELASSTSVRKPSTKSIA